MILSQNSQSKCLIVAEVAQTHDGSLGTAHSFVDAVSKAGADAIKFQTHIASAESTPSEPWRVKFSRQDASRYDYWKRMEFSEEQWSGLKQHADDNGLKFISSPFSIEAVEMLKRVGVAAWKIASGEVNSAPMFDSMAETGLPFFVSTGMSPLSEIDTVVERVNSKGVPLTLMQCTSMYPTPAEKVGLNVIRFFRERYGCSVGLSDHSGTIYAGLAAATIGIDVLEVHVTLTHEMFGPDVPVSVTPSELRQLVEGVRFIERMQAHPVNKDEVAGQLKDMRGLFNKSVVLRTNLPAGTILRREHLTTKKPGTGIPADRIDALVGKRLRCDGTADQLLRDEDLEV